MPPHRNHVHAGLADLAHPIQRHAARRLDDGARRAFANPLDRFAHLAHREVVDQDDLGPRLDRFLAGCARFSTSTAMRRPCGAWSARPADALAHAAHQGDVVVLDQDPRRQIRSVVVAASGTHGVFFQGAHAGHGLARIGDAQLGAAGRRHVGLGQGGDAGQPLDEIKRRAFARQHRLPPARAPSQPAFPAPPDRRRPPWCARGSRQSKRMNTASTTPRPHTTSRSRAMMSASAS